jgi:hypothetical protein
MVIVRTEYSLLTALADSSATGLERLDPVTRARALMALLGLVLLGVTLVACVMIGGRWVRRLARHLPHAVGTQIQSSRSATRAAPRGITQAVTGDTLVGEHLTDETRIN